MDTVRVFDVQNDGSGLDYFIPPEDEIDISTLPDVFSRGYIALVTGARHATKQLPVTKLISLCDETSEPVILLGGPDDRDTANAIGQQTRGTVLNACGQYNINQSASLIRQSRVVITHDTGLMHVAAAFRKKIISLWGNTIPEFGMYPYQPDPQSVIFEVKGLSCRPCSKIGLSKCPRKHFRCMKPATDEIFRFKQWGIMANIIQYPPSVLGVGEELTQQKLNILIFSL
jgi:heptosyltransferase-2